MDDLKNETLNVYNKLLYSDVSAKGGIRNEGYEKKLSLDSMYQSYKYRRIYNLGNGKYTRGTNYLIDPFSVYLKERYISNVAINKNEQQSTEKQHTYIFYSLFDIDIFVRKNYRDDSSDDSIKYTFDSLNKVFKDKRISRPIFMESTDKREFAYPKIFTEFQIELIKMLYARGNVKPNFPKSKSDAIKLLDIIIEGNSSVFNRNEFSDLMQIREELLKPRTQLAPRINIMEIIFDTSKKINILNSAMKDITR